MAYTKNSIFYDEFVLGGVSYRVEFTPADVSILSSPTYVKLPAFAIAMDGFDFKADYDGNIAIAIHNSKEFTLKVVGDAFTGDFAEVFGWIVESGVVNTRNDFVSNITNKWELFIHDGTSYKRKYTGFQIANGAGAVYDFNTKSSILTYEVKVQDVMRAVLSEITLTADMADLNLETERPDIVANHTITCANGNKLVLSGISQYFKVIDNNNVVVMPIGSIKTISYDHLIVNLESAIVNAMYTKFRATNTVSVTYFDGDFLDGYTFYNTDFSYDAAHTRGAAVAQSDLLLVAQKETETGVWGWNIMIDGIFAKSNMYDLLKYLSENFGKRIYSYYSETAGFSKLKIVKAHNSIGTYNLTPNNVLSEFTVEQSRDVTARQNFHISNISGNDISNTEYVGDATLIRQDSYEIDSVIDNYCSNADGEWGTKFVYGTPNDFQTVSWLLNPNSEHLNMFYTLDSSDSRAYILRGVHNSCGYDGFDYGYNGKNPLIPNAVLNDTEMASIQNYILRTQTFDMSSPLTSGGGIGTAFVWNLASLYGIPANPYTLTIDVSADDFDISKFGYTTSFNYTDFLGGIPTFNLGIPVHGYIVGIESFDITKNIYKCIVILNS